VKRILSKVWTVLSSRALPPLVCGVFLLTYIGLAFGTDDTLIALMEFTRTSVILAVLLALIPLNGLCRIVTETNNYLKRCHAISGEGIDNPDGLFDESVSVAASPAFAGMQDRLAPLGYTCRCTENILAAWRGISIFPARLLFLTGALCLFAGILISLTTRTSHRMNVFEGEPLPTAKGGGGLVEMISLKPSTGAILDKNLVLKVAQSEAGDGSKVFGLYPPSLYRGYFVYPRYLGIAPVIIFSAPESLSVYEKMNVLNVYPPGKEDRIEIPGSPYQIILSMAKPDDGSDPFVTGNITIQFKLLKGKAILFGGAVPTGGEFVRDGYRLSIPESRRMVITDFIQDYGVLLVWAAAMFFICAGFLWLPIRAFFPRREMVFMITQYGVTAYSRAEGGRKNHAGIFNESLDLLEARRPADM
jgi:hypothetical protein